MHTGRTLLGHTLLSSHFAVASQNEDGVSVEEGMRRTITSQEAINRGEHDDIEGQGQEEIGRTVT